MWPAPLMALSHEPVNPAGIGKVCGGPQLVGDTRRHTACVYFCSASLIDPMIVPSLLMSSTKACPKSTSAPDGRWIQERHVLARASKLRLRIMPSLLMATAAPVPEDRITPPRIDRRPSYGKKGEARHIVRGSDDHAAVVDIVGRGCRARFRQRRWLCDNPEPLDRNALLPLLAADPDAVRAELRLRRDDDERFELGV